MKSLSTREKALVAVTAIILAVCLLSIDKCNKAQQRAANAELDYQNANATIQTFKLDLSNKDRVIATQDVLIGSERHARILAESEAKKYKSVQGAVKVKTQFVIKEVAVPYTKHDTVQTDFAGVEYGTQAGVNTQYYSLLATIDTNNLVINELKVPLEWSLVWGKQKRGFLKTPVNTYSLVVTNPHVQVLGVQNVAVKPKKPKRLLWLLTGVVLGAATNFIH